MGTPLGARVERFRRGYMHVVAALAATGMAAMAGITCVQVFYRYFLASPLIWAEEICRYLMIWTCFLFAGAAFQRGEMASIELLTASLPRRLRGAVMAPAYAVTTVFLGMLVYYGWLYASENSAQAIATADFISQSLLGHDSGLTMFWVYVSVPVGAAVLGVHFVGSTVQALIEAVTPPANGTSESRR